jgi:phage shock protein PspC (stress-responsive transcriptional regulator)
MDTTMTDEPSPATPPPPHGPATPPRSPRRLTRSRDDRVIGGIAGGIAHTYGWDPGLVRMVIAVAAVITAGAIAVAYGIAWFVIPEDTTGLTGVDVLRGDRPHRGREAWALPVGVVLVAAGMLAIAHRVAWAPFSDLFWPITLIAGGLAVLFVRHREPPAAGDVPPPATPTRDTSPSDPTGDELVAAPIAPTVPVATDAPTPSDATDTTDRTDVHDTIETTAARVTTATVPAYPPPSEPWPTTAIPEPERPPRPPRERSALGRLTWSALLLLVGGSWLIDATNAAAVDASFVIALALVIVGLALVAGAWFGRSRGLIALAIVLVAVCSVDAALEVPLRGGIGARVYRVESANTTQRLYELAIGQLTVDLRDVTTADRTIHLEARDAIGQLRIYLPPDAEVDVRSRVGSGDAEVIGQPDANGWQVDQRTHIAGTGPHFVIDARVGFGQLVISENGSTS